MRNFLRIATGVDVTPALLELHRQPELWDEFTERKTADRTPHAAMSDIWLRYRARADLEADRSSYLTPHTPVFYPAWSKLPALRPIVFGVMTRVQAVQLGGMLITRLPPGGEILPHDDLGSWHAEFFNTKAYVALSSPPGCWNSCGGEVIHMASGDVWTFDNLLPHAVGNPSDEDRITLIVSMRCES